MAHFKKTSDMALEYPCDPEDIKAGYRPSPLFGGTSGSKVDKASSFISWCLSFSSSIEHPAVGLKLGKSWKSLYRHEDKATRPSAINVARQPRLLIPTPQTRAFCNSSHKHQTESPLPRHGSCEVSREVSPQAHLQRRSPPCVSQSL